MYALLFHPMKQRAIFGRVYGTVILKKDFLRIFRKIINYIVYKCKLLLYNIVNNFNYICI